MKKRLFRVCVMTLAVVSVFFTSYVLYAEQLSSMKIKEIEKGIEKLEAKERGVQRKGYRQVKALGEISIPYLIEALKDKTVNFESRILMCDLLGEWKAKDAVPVLLYTLDNTSYTVRTAACKALGNIGDPAATDSLLEMLGDSSPHVREAASRALVGFSDKRIAPRAAKLLSDDSDSVRLAAITLLDDQLDPSTAPAIRKALEDDPAAGVRSVAAKALGGLKDEKAVDLLMNSLIEDGGEGVRKESATALGKIGDEKAVPALIEGTNDGYKDVQLCAASSLKELTGEDFGRNYKEWKSWYTRTHE